ncbi:MAG: DEAD/DEAH box helicase [Porphyromonadaceae bacterium]|nr:DEAD/DEAH box helicase [Porphyromonadaceae bacterium]
MNTLRLYDYQEQMLREIEDVLSEPSTQYVLTGGNRRLRQGRSVMVQMPTGTGKTFLMAAVIGRFLDRNPQGGVWIVAHRRELVAQIQEILARFGIGRLAERRNGIRVMSIQWLSRHVREIQTAPGLIVVDEAHHSVAPTYQKLWESFPEARKLGMTATPCRMQKRGFPPLFDQLLTSWSINEFIRKGRLSLYDYVVINRNSEEQITIDGLKKRGADGDFSTVEMEEKLNTEAIIGRLYKSVERYANGKKGIVYAIDIRHARKIAELYARNGMRAEAIDSKTPALRRKRVVEDFKAGRIDCLVNVNLFDEGFDCPDVEFIQMARPTLSLSKYMQMIGRGLRVHPDKKLCVIIDNVGLYRLFGLPNAERDWPAMFAGEVAGKGSLRRKRKEIRVINNDMEIVASHSHLLPQSKEERERYLERVEPFEKDGRWGLRVGEEIILNPIYMKIMPFVGKYSAFELIPNNWGVLLRNGKQYIPAQFRSIEILPDGDAIMTRNEISRRRVHLDTTFSDPQDRWEWWGFKGPFGEGPHSSSGHHMLCM